MPELLDDASMMGQKRRQLAPGDVIMVARKMRDKDTGRKFDWKFFMVVTRHKRWLVIGCVVGNERLKGQEMTIKIGDEKNTIHYLPPEEWPDGVHAFRMAMILKGQIEGVV